MRVSYVLPLLSLFLSQTTAAALGSSPHKLSTLRQCQTTGKNCPEGTIIVSQTNTTTSKKQIYKTIQSAINTLPNNTHPATILIKAGTYNEQLNITRAGPITFIGETTNPKDATANQVRITWSAANKDSTGQSVDNVYSSVLVVAPTLESSLTGSGTTGYAVPDDTPFGNVDFRVYNVDFVNEWSDYSDGPAHALSLSRANGGFYYCGFFSYQDTVYIGKLGNAYFYKSIIAGQTDFLYGFGTAWIQSSKIQLRGCGGGITAWKGTNTTFTNKYGVYIVDSDVRAANTSIAPDIIGECALGRPWNSQHRSIFARCTEDGSITASGYIDWVVSGVARFQEGVTLMAEYAVSGAGFNRTGRIEGGVTTLLDRKAWKGYSEPERVFQEPTGEFGNVGWIDWGVIGEK